MADEAQQPHQHGVTIRSINWRELFPFTNLFRAFRIAVHPSKLALALIALLLLYFGGRILDLCWMDKYLVRPGDLFYPTGLTGGEGNPRGIFISFFDYEVGRILPTFELLLHFKFAEAYKQIVAFLLGPVALFHTHWLFGVLFTAWFLLIWSLFGGAISRIAAVHVARDEKISVRQALRFSAGKILSFLFAPIIPLLIILFLGLVIATGGLLYFIPIVGPIVASILFFLALIAGFIATLVLVGTLGGFNLMYPTIAVEGSDSFDAISRSFSYVFARPWRMLFYTIVSLLYGAITYLFVRFFIFLTLLVTWFFVTWFFGDETQPARYFPAMWPAPDPDKLPYSVAYDSLKWSESFAGGMTAFWNYLVIGLLGAYAISFYFSVNTIIYYLMRREVDATELDDVYIEDTDDEFGATDTVVTPGTTTTTAASPAPAEGTTSAPGGGVSGTAGSADAGGSPSGAAQPYTPPPTDAPPQGG